MSAQVAAKVTGSPATACPPTQVASATNQRRWPCGERARSAHQRIHGMNAMAQEKFGKLPADTIGPASEKSVAPTKAAAAEQRRRSHSHMPSAISGNGAATQRLNPTTSG